MYYYYYTVVVVVIVVIFGCDCVLRKSFNTSLNVPLIVEFISVKLGYAGKFTYDIPDGILPTVFKFTFTCCLLIFY